MAHRWTASKKKKRNGMTSIPTLPPVRGKRVARTLETKRRGGARRLQREDNGKKGKERVSRPHGSLVLWGKDEASGFLRSAEVGEKGFGGPSRRTKEKRRPEKKKDPPFV